MLFTLAYVSRALVPFPPGEIAHLLERCRAVNARVGVTGALVYNGEGFAQVLEGPRPAVLEVLARIRADPRHTGLLVMGVRDVPARRFAAWTMAEVDGRGLAPADALGWLVDVALAESEADLAVALARVQARIVEDAPGDPP